MYGGGVDRGQVVQKMIAKGGVEGDSVFVVCGEWLVKIELLS